MAGGQASPQKPQPLAGTRVVYLMAKRQAREIFPEIVLVKLDTPEHDPRR